MIKKVRSPKSIRVKTSGQATRPTTPHVSINKKKEDIKKVDIPKGPDEVDIDDIIL